MLSTTRADVNIGNILPISNIDIGVKQRKTLVKIGKVRQPWQDCPNSYKGRSNIVYFDKDYRKLHLL